MPSVYPASDLDRPDAALAALGSFWADTYEGSYPVRAFAHAFGRLAGHAFGRMRAAVGAAGRATLEPYRRREWFALTLKESERNRTAYNLRAFGDGGPPFGPDAGSFGVPTVAAAFTYPTPTGLAGAAACCNRLTDSSLTWVSGVDFVLRPGSVTFRDDPFADPRVAVEEVVQGTDVVDRTATLWLYAAVEDADDVYRQYGYAIGVRRPTSASYLAVVRAAFDALVDGGTALSVDRVVAAACGVPLAGGAETVEDVAADARGLVVVTDAAAYRFRTGAAALVAAGDAVAAGDPLADPVRVFEFGRGAVPPGVSALAVGPGFLPAGYAGDLVFRNETAPLTVEEGVDGYTKVSFPLGGWAADVAAFWRECHAKGVAAGQTLAMLLDGRPAAARTTQPVPASLPAVVNPLAFLCANVLRNNAYLVVLKPALFGPGATGLAAVPAVVRKVVPPHTCCLFLVKLAGAAAPGILPAGDAVRVNAGRAHAEDTTPAWSESVTARQTAGHCV